MSSEGVYKKSCKLTYIVADALSSANGAQTGRKQSSKRAHKKCKEIAKRAQRECKQSANRAQTERKQSAKTQAHVFELV